MDKNTDPENFWHGINISMTFQNYLLLATVSIWCYKNWKKQHPSVRAYNTQCRDEQRMFLIPREGVDTNPVFFPLHVHHVFPVVSIIFLKELQNCAVVEPDQSGIMLLGSKSIRDLTGCIVFIIRWLNRSLWSMVMETPDHLGHYISCVSSFPATQQGYSVEELGSVKRFSPPFDSHTERMTFLWPNL